MIETEVSLHVFLCHWTNNCKRNKSIRSFCLSLYLSAVHSTCPPLSLSLYPYLQLPAAYRMMMLLREYFSNWLNRKADFDNLDTLRLPWEVFFVFKKNKINLVNTSISISDEYRGNSIDPSHRIANLVISSHEYGMYSTFPIHYYLCLKQWIANAMRWTQFRKSSAVLTKIDNISHMNVERGSRSSWYEITKI